MIGMGLGSGFEGAAAAEVSLQLGASGRVLEVPVRVILDNDDVVFLAEGIEVSASWEGKDGAGWVLADSIENFSSTLVHVTI